MTVNAKEPISGPFIADGVNDTFEFTFKVIDQGHMSVFVTDEDGRNGQAYSTGISIDPSYLDQDNGGFLTFRINNAPVPAGKTITPMREVPYDQPNRIGNQGRYYPELHEKSFDYLAMQIQQVQGRLKRVAISNPGREQVTIVATGPSKLLYINENNELVESETAINEKSLREAADQALSERIDGQTSSLIIIRDQTIAAAVRGEEAEAGAKQHLEDTQAVAATFVITANNAVEAVNDAGASAVNQVNQAGADAITAIDGSVDLAFRWASFPYGEEVIPSMGYFSALHWAEVSRIAAIGSVKTVNNKPGPDVTLEASDLGLENVPNKTEQQMVDDGPIHDALQNIQPKVNQFATLALAAAAALPADAAYIEIMGWDAAGDGGRALYAVRPSEPTHPGKFALQAGKWAEIAMSRYEPRMFGAKADYNISTGAGTDSAAAFQNMLDTSKALGGVPMVISGRYRINSGVTLTNSQCSIVGDWFSGSIIASPITTGNALNVTQDTYLNGTHIEGVTFIALALQTAGAALRVSYSAADSINNRSSARCFIKGVNAYPRLQASHSWFNGILLRNVHNATLDEIGAAGGRNFSLPETDVGHWSRMNAGIRLEADTGQTAIPSDIYISNPRIFHSYYGIHCSGEYEGIRIDNHILVAVHTGIYAVMASQRPWLQVESGHINYLKYGIYALNFPQTNIDNQLLYKNQNSRESSTAIVLATCPHSQVDNIRCYNLNTDYTLGNDHIGIALVNGSSYCTIGDLIITNPSVGVIIWDATTGCRIKTPVLQGVYTNAPVRSAVSDNSTGANEYGGMIAAVNNASAMNMGTSSTNLAIVNNLTMGKGERVRVTVSISGNRANAGTVFAAVQPGSTDGGIGVFGQTGSNLPNKYFGATGDWDMTFSGVFSCVTGGTFSLTLQGLSGGTLSTIAANKAQMLIERM